MQRVVAMLGVKHSGVSLCLTKYILRKPNLFQPIPAQKSNALIFEERF